MCAWKFLEHKTSNVHIIPIHVHVSQWLLHWKLPLTTQTCTCSVRTCIFWESKIAMCFECCQSVHKITSLNFFHQINFFLQLKILSHVLICARQYIYIISICIVITVRGICVWKTSETRCHIAADLRQVWKGSSGELHKLLEELFT